MFGLKTTENKCLPSDKTLCLWCHTCLEIDRCEWYVKVGIYWWVGAVFDLQFHSTHIAHSTQHETTCFYLALSLSWKEPKYHKWSGNITNAPAFTFHSEENEWRRESERKWMMNKHKIYLSHSFFESFGNGILLKHQRLRHHNIRARTTHTHSSSNERVSQVFVNPVRL